MPEDGDLSEATLRELIVLLALVEDEFRNSAVPEQIAALARRECAIKAALHRHALASKGPFSPYSPRPTAAPCGPGDVSAQKVGAQK